MTTGISSITKQPVAAISYLTWIVLVLLTAVIAVPEIGLVPAVASAELV